VGIAGSSTRTRGEQVKQFVHNGPYRLVRNPLYIANIFLYTACSLLFGFSGFSVLVFIYSCVEYTFIVSFEETLLAQTFGQVYLDYCEKIPRWLPLFKPTFPRSNHSFHLGTALRSERGTFYSMLAMCLAFFFKKLVF
jgi:protein-S-isoprenylcysteine O-methyltransferase Ste14